MQQHIQRVAPRKSASTVIILVPQSNWAPLDTGQLPRSQMPWRLVTLLVLFFSSGRACLVYRRKRREVN